MRGCHDRFDVWADLATLGGTYELEQREFAFRFDKGTIFCRNRYFDSKQQALDFLEKFKFKGTYEPHFNESNNRWGLPLIFKNASHLRSYLSSRKGDFSIEFGPVYPGRDRVVEKNDQLIVKHVPLLFDVDIDEVYDEKRFCKCKNKKQVCNDCWRQLMVPAIKELRHLLCDVFQFKSVLFVFSGRRGFHTWVLDREVWSYSAAQRQAIYGKVVKTRLDENLTKDPCHLIKVPLLQHPATGKWAIPIDETFLPDDLGMGQINLQNYIAEIDKKIKDGM